jgi:hypothetical protein
MNSPAWCQESCGRIVTKRRRMFGGPAQGTTREREKFSRPSSLHKLGNLVHFRFNFRRGCDRTLRPTDRSGGRSLPGYLPSSILPGLLIQPVTCPLYARAVDIFGLRQRINRLQHSRTALPAVFLEPAPVRFELYSSPQLMANSRSGACERSLPFPAPGT